MLSHLFNLQHIEACYTAYAWYLIQNDIKMAYLHRQLKHTLTLSDLDSWQNCNYRLEPTASCTENVINEF